MRIRAHGHFVSTICVHKTSCGDGGLLILTNRLAPLRIAGQITGRWFTALTFAHIKASVRVYVEC